MMQEFVQRINDAADEAVNKIHTAMPGKITKYDPATNLADVEPIMKYKLPDGTTKDYPKISGVPVWHYQYYLQKATVAFPVEVGDECLVVVAEKSIDYWLFGQETDTDWYYDLTDAVVIPGLFKKPNPVVQEAYEKKNIIIDLEGMRITFKKSERQIVADVDGTKITIQPGIITLDAPVVNINGNLNVSGVAKASAHV